MTQPSLYRSNGFEVTPALVRFGDQSMFVRQIASVRLHNNLVDTWRWFKISATTMGVRAAIVLPVMAVGSGPGNFGSAYQFLAILALWMIGPIAAVATITTGVMAAYHKFVRRGGNILVLTASDRSVTQINVPSSGVGRALKDAIEQAVAMRN